jgi:3-methyladenine DNA glycosylase AlkD
LNLIRFAPAEGSDLPVLAATRTQARALAREFRDEPAALVARARSAFAAGDRLLAFEICRAAPRAVAGMTARQVRSFAAGMTEWWAADCFAVFIAGVAWREGALSDAEILRWTASRDRWMRRAALAATVPLNNRSRGADRARGEARRTLAICRRLIHDRDDMVVKALSWALRELARRDRAAVAGFVEKYDGKLAPRVTREVRNKLETGLKNPRVRTRPALRRLER